MVHRVPVVSVGQIAAVPLFAELAHEALRDIADAMELVDLREGQVLVQQGEVGHRLFVVLEGTLETLLERPGEEDQALSELGSGDVVGEVAVLGQTDRTATVRSRTPARLAAITRGELLRLADTHPAIVAVLVASGARRLRRSQLAIYLKELFGELEPAHLDELERRVEWIRLRGGEVLWSPGDPGDAAYVVLGGRLRVLATTPDGEIRTVEEVVRGQMVGETSLLTHAPRTTTVVAIRDSEIALIGGDVLGWFAERHPVATLRIMAAIGERLERAIAGEEDARPAARPVTFALVAASPDVALAEFAGQLATTIRRAGSTIVLTTADAATAAGAPLPVAVPAAATAGVADDPAEVRLTHWLDEHESAHRYVLYVADPGWTWWTDTCVRQADHLIVVADATADPRPGDVERRLTDRWPAAAAPRRTLILVHPPTTSRPRGTRFWLAPRELDQHLHVRRGASRDIDRLARLLTGRAITVVLGGGGARGYAHIGVLRAFDEVGVPIDMIGGTSMGGLMAASRALGWSADETEARWTRATRSLFDPTLPLMSVLSGRRIWQAIESGFGGLDVEDLWLPFFCVSTNLTRAELVVHRTGSLSLALRASASLPAILPPVYRDGDLLIDGGLLDTLPVDVMRQLNGGSLVVGVDVAPQVDLGSGVAFEPELSGWRVLRNRLRRRGPGPRMPGIVELLNRTVVVPSLFLERRLGRERIADVTFSPAVARFGTLALNRVRPIARAGYESTIDPVRAWWREHNRRRR